MNNFFNDLKDIKKTMLEKEKTEEVKVKKSNPNRDEFKDIFVDEEESLEDKKSRLQDEFKKYVEFNKVKKV